jgi:hypothetical protein
MDTLPKKTQLIKILKSINTTNLQTINQTSQESHPPKKYHPINPTLSHNKMKIRIDSI